MSEKWFGEGLRFACTRCGACCTGGPGFVFLRRGEAEAISAFLAVGVEAFLSEFTRPVGNRRSLKEDDGGSCVFLTPGGCRVYPVRPVQCSTFPFWLRIVANRGSWEEASRECPGMNSGRLYRLEEIEDFIARRL